MTKNMEGIPEVPTGALAREEAEKLASVRGSIIYKVYSRFDREMGNISKVVVRSYTHGYSLKLKEGSDHKW